MYHLTHAPSPFCFQQGSYIFAGLASNRDPSPTSASVSWITGVSHHAWHTFQELNSESERVNQRLEDICNMGTVNDSSKASVTITGKTSPPHPSWQPMGQRAILNVH
jgi:hypothetical protein